VAEQTAGRKKAEQTAGRKKHESVEGYLAGLTPEQRSKLDQLRAAVGKGLPDEAQEVISYQIIGYRVGKGRPVVWLAAFADHFSVYPYTDHMRAELGAQIEPYISGKGTIKLPADQPLPLELVTRVAQVLLARARYSS
jgi:uncharacterized protein YdhG (YjbR/CyaY superfamily)